jgi:hypothetical protein
MVGSFCAHACRHQCSGGVVGGSEPSGQTFRQRLLMQHRPQQQLETRQVLRGRRRHRHHRDEVSQELGLAPLHDRVALRTHSSAAWTAERRSTVRAASAQTSSP